MAARKSSRTTQPQPSRARISDTPSSVRNSQVGNRRDRVALEVEPASTSEPFEVASTSEPFGAAVDDDDIERALDLERPPQLQRRIRSPGTLATLGDSDASGGVDSGMPMEPEDMGVQFLSGATEQGNFESQLLHDDGDGGVVILPHVVISDATLDTSMQVDAEWLEGDASQDKVQDVPAEPFERNVDLTQDTIAAASLFDQVVPDETLNDDELDDVPVEGMTMEPTLHTEDPSDPAMFAEAREREMRRVRREMLKKRQQAEQVTTTPPNGK